MSQNPLNLAVRFILEIIALVGLGYGGWHAATGSWRYLVAILLPVMAAALWGVFRTPNEPHHPAHATRPVRGRGRLLIEALILGGGAWGLFSTGATILAWIYTLAVIIHYALSYDRVAWLLRH